MLNKISKQFAEFLIRKTQSGSEKEEIYVYGLELILSTCAGFFSILLLSGFWKEVMSGIVFICFFAPLRMFAGGYHANTYRKCFCISNISYFLILSTKELIWKEPAQTYTYDTNGNLVSVQSTGNGNEIYKYDTQNLEKLEKYKTEGNGEYSYEYGNANNQYLPTKVTNVDVSMNIGYSIYGEATSTTLESTQGSEKMKSTASYNDGLLVQQTDNTGATAHYGYTSARDCDSVTYANGQRIRTFKDGTWGHVDRTYQSGVISATFGYLNGNLSTITRGGYLDLAHSDGKKYNQIYGFEYDKFGNRTKITLKGEIVNKSSGAVESTSGTSTLATYTYQANNGPLTSMTYGPSTGTKVTYTYDALERVKSVKYSDTNTTYGYNYSAEGSLAGITVNGTPAYEYTYDSLGRLIYSAKLQNQRPVLYTSHQYDTSNRIENQSWQIGSDSFSESYTYNENDGTLSSMTSGGDALGFTYNNLKQLSGRTSPKLDMTYTYRTWTDTQNKQWQTNQVASVQYMKHGTDDLLLSMLNYSYDSVGNIAQIKENSSNAAQYSYDGKQ